MVGLRLVVTSIVRYAGKEQRSGFVGVLDFDRKKVLMKSPFSESIYRAKDPNPRGGFRGARGVTIYEDHLIIANAERLLIFDSSWKFVGEITHPWMGEFTIS